MRNKSYRDKLIRIVMAQGHSLRKSRLVVNAVFDLMALGVRRGDIVDVPGGKLQSAEAKQRQWVKRNALNKGTSSVKGLKTNKQYRYVPKKQLADVVIFTPDKNFYEE